MFGVRAIFYISRHMLNPVKPSLNDLLGPSIMLLVLDMLIDNPNQWMNLGEISRRVKKNPGSTSSVIPKLMERGLLDACKIGKVSVAYKLNFASDSVKALIILRNSLRS